MFDLSKRSTLSKILFVAFTAAGLALVGCSNKAKIVPVSGKVLIDGVPVKKGCIIFKATGVRQSTGVIDDSGQFKLTYIQKDDGAVLGKHQVQVLGSEALGDRAIKWHIPPKYGNPTTSGLTQEITGPTDSVEIKLTWKGSPPEHPYEVPLEGGSMTKGGREGAKN